MEGDKMTLEIAYGLVTREFEICREKFDAGDYKWAMLSEDLQNKEGCEGFLRGLIWCRIVMASGKQINNSQLIINNEGSREPEARQDLVELVGKAVLAIENSK